LGSSNIGNVKLGLYQEDQFVAVKQLIGQKNLSIEEQFDAFQREVVILGGLSFPSIVQLKAFSFCSFTLVLEHIPKNNLYDWLKTKPALSAALRIRIAIDVASAMKYLHSLNPPLLHGNLNSSDILLVDDNPEKDIVAKETNDT